MSQAVPKPELLDFQAKKEDDSDSWQRADGSPGNFEPGESIEEWTVNLPDSDESHQTWLIESGRGFEGWCTCDGFEFHDGPCAHLCARRKAAVLDDVPIPERDSVLEDDDVQEESTESDERDVGDVQGHLDEEASGTIVPDEQTADVDDLESHPDEPAVVAPDEFADQLGELPEQYVMRLGGRPYIRREGYAIIARSAGLRVRAVPVVPAHETGFEHALYRGQVWEAGDDPGEGWEDVGTARLEHENMDTAEKNLDELAATRAITRALSWATGAGISAAEVLQGGESSA